MSTGPVTRHDGLPKVALICTGGTIASLAPNPLESHDYVGGELLDSSGLLEHFPEVNKFADVIPIEFPTFISDNVTAKEWHLLARTCERLATEKPELNGIVVAHGTATLEETAFAMNLVLKCRRTLPLSGVGSARQSMAVVFVGSVRSANALSSDAGLNLVNAVRVAFDPSSRGRGVLVVMNDEVHAARDVAKCSTGNVNAFRTPDFGVLGHVDADRISYYRKTERRCMPDTAFGVDCLDRLPRVDISYAYAGADGSAVRAFIAVGAKGIISAGFAPGGTSPGEDEALVEAAKAGIVVVQTTRVGSGRVLETREMREKGRIAGDNLTPHKARILLQLGLTKTNDRREIEKMFSEY